MVLDIRHLAQPEPEPEPESAPDVAAASTTGSADPLPNLEELIALASADRPFPERAKAVEQLRNTVPSDTGFDLLWSIVEAD